MGGLMELPGEVEKLVEDIIDLLRIDEERKREMKQDSDVYLISLLLHFKGAMTNPQSHSLHYSYAFSAISYRSLVRAQGIVGKNNIPMVRFLEPISEPCGPRRHVVSEKTGRYGRHKKRKTA